MSDLGLHNHENVEKQYLMNKGFSERVTTIIGNHVKTKRYLISTNYQKQVNKHWNIKINNGF